MDTKVQVPRSDGDSEPYRVGIYSRSLMMLICGLWHIFLKVTRVNF